ncbi:MAG: DUF4249 family protein [Cyclobacteriaceae bacterium]|nr:DUF4249 family protein [Cyclobacteriaceae bacterium]
MDSPSNPIHRIGTILLLMILGVLGGCIPDPLEVENVPSLQPKIVIGSQVVPDQGLLVYVTRSIGALEAGWGSEIEPLLQQIAITDALVTLHYDSEVDTLVHQAYGVYVGASNAVVAGKTYTLHVNSPRWGKVQATSTAPRQVFFNSVEASLYLTGYDSLARIKYSLFDPEEPNWYMINVQKISATTPVDRYLNPRVFTRLVQDTAFNGQRFEEEFNVIFQNYTEGDSVLVTMSNISPEYYHYLWLRNDSRYSLAGFASEPLNFPTNVQGGYGYFNLHVPDVRVFVLD